MTNVFSQNNQIFGPQSAYDTNYLRSKNDMIRRHSGDFTQRSFYSDNSDAVSIICIAMILNVHYMPHLLEVLNVGER